MMTLNPSVQLVPQMAFFCSSACFVHNKTYHSNTNCLWNYHVMMEVYCCWVCKVFVEEIKNMVMIFLHILPMWLWCNAVMNAQDGSRWAGLASTDGPILWCWCLSLLLALFCRDRHGHVITPHIAIPKCIIERELQTMKRRPWLAFWMGNIDATQYHAIGLGWMMPHNPITVLELLQQKLT